MAGFGMGFANLGKATRDIRARLLLGLLTVEDTVAEAAIRSLVHR